MKYPNLSFKFTTNMIKLILIIAGVLILWEFVGYRKRAIKEKLVNVEMTPIEERELQILACEVIDRARKDGIDVPKKNGFICRLDDDPYTWVILRLGLRKDKEIYRTRFSITEVANAKIEAELEQNKEGDT